MFDLKNKYKFLILLIICLLPSELLSSFSDIELDLKEAIVVIADQNNKPIGTGTFINEKGLIITAKHVVEDSIENTKADSYLISTPYRLSNDNKFDNAELVAVHPYFDVAILKAIAPGDKIKSIKIGTSKTLDKEKDKLYLFGHKIISSLEEIDLYKSLTANINDLDHNGYIKVSQGGASGMSGGPVFNSDGKLVGIIKHVESSESTVVPIDSIIDGFKILGIHLNFNTHARESDTIAEIYNKINELEIMALDLNSNLIWYATPKMNCRNNKKCDLELTFHYGKNFITQPDLDNTLFNLEIKPYIEGLDHVDPDELSFNEREWFLPEDNSVTFRNILLSIEDKINSCKKTKKMGINVEKSLKIISVTISFKTSFNKSLSGVEVERKVCFTIPFESLKKLSKSPPYVGLNCHMDQIKE